MIKPATSIDEVISFLQEIIDYETRLNSPLAYFPALYRLVTTRVKQGLGNREFEDSARMEKLDILFANRYIEAYIAGKNQKPHTGSWRIVFEAEKKPLLILQHLLLGMNAHINLDLGIAAAETAKGKELDLLHNDFNTINRLLSEMTEKVQSKIGKVSPLMGLLDKLAGNTDTMLVNFSISEARDGAWKSAVEFHAINNSMNLLTLRDKKISALGLALIYPNSRWVRGVVSAIRMAESKNVGRVVEQMVSG
jgi:hypothetical protein